MTDLHSRLTVAFQTVFPTLSQDQIRSASPRVVSEWDSVASISLVNVIEEEFNVVIDLEDIALLDSFDAIATYLQERAEF